MENTAVSQQPGHDGARGEQDRDAKTITATLGSSFQIHLWEDRTRGELWVPSCDHRSLVLVSDDSDSQRQRGGCRAADVRVQSGYPWHASAGV